MPTLRWKGGFIRGMIQALFNTIFSMPTFKLRLGTLGGRRWLGQWLTCADLDHCVHRARISCLALHMPTRSRARPGFVCVFRPKGAWKDDDPGAGSNCDLCREPDLPKHWPRVRRLPFKRKQRASPKIDRTMQLKTSSWPSTKLSSQCAGRMADSCTCVG